MIVRRGAGAATAALALAVAVSTGLQAQTPVEPAVFGGLVARPIGPAVMSGRVAAIAAAPDSAGGPATLWVGAASGGLWKSTDDGTTFRPVFDDHAQSIGAVAVAPSNPAHVWVGTGETWVRNSVSYGDGVYRSTDGGDSWRHVGLADSERIGRIAVHPTRPDTAYVCALGHLYDDHEERGVFRTEDGGETWTKVLYVDESTGCADLSMDPGEPDILYAALWDHRRQPWTFRSGGPGSGLYRTLDGGATWTELTEGLPAGEKGRIAVAVAPSRPSTVYALVEADETALYRSDDLGGTWREVNNSSNITVRPFYFAHIVVDPTDHERVYKPGLTLTTSSDGGVSFTSPMTSMRGASVHSDHHALWVDPADPQHLVLGTDGGVYISRDRGNHWRHVRSLPISQFYEISVDTMEPYNVYGGLQDNGTWFGPSRGPGGIRGGAWKNIGFGDGFHAFVDPRDANDVYVEYQGGNLLRWRRTTDEIKVIRPYAGVDESKLRFNWNTPLHVGPSGAFYAGAQYLFRTRDRGESWERISPDLTTNEPEKQKQAESGGLTIDNTTAENHTTIYTIAESPHDASVIWVGTDDGNVQVTRDGGATWTNVVATVPGLPAHTWVSHIEVSPHSAGAAFATFDGHMTGDMRTYAFTTSDYGATWRTLATDSLRGHASVIKQDPVNPDLLFLGTEMGLYLSLDRGVSWVRYEGGDWPVRVPVRDLAIHPREHDLVIGTHGRGIWILDDLSPLRALTPEALSRDIVLLPARPAELLLAGNLQSFPGDDEFVGQNPEDAALITYYQRRRHMFGDLKVEVYDPQGELITTLPGGKLAGINRVVWPMRLAAPKVPPASSLSRAFVGPRVPEGTYTYRLIKGDSSYEGSIDVVFDPRGEHSAEDRALQQRTALDLYEQLGRLTYVVDATTELRDTARARADAAGGRTARRLNGLADELETFRVSLVATADEGMMSGDEKLREDLSEVYAAVSGYDGRPTSSQVERARTLALQLERAEARFETLSARARELGLPVLAKAAWREK